MNTFLWLCILILAALLCELHVWPLPQPFRDRGCQGRDWRRAFPSASKEEIRTFLGIFVDAFGFATRERLRFRTGDSILQVYRAIYPSKLVPDSLELEALAIDVEAFYGVKLDALWREDLTLGELFASTLGAAQP